MPNSEANMEFNNIIEKYNYSAEFANFLKQIYDEFVKYYGGEEIIYEAFFNTPIVNVSNCYDYLQEKDYLEDTESLVDEDDLKRSSGTYHSNPVIEYDSNTNTYRIVEIKRCVLVKEFDITYENSKACLIHELSHLVKGYHDEYEINGDILIERCGFITKVYKLSFKDGKVKKETISEKGVGFEEGLTSVAEEDIMRSIVNPEYKAHGYGVVNAIARNFFSYDYLRNAILNAEVYKSREEFYELIASDLYEKLENITDRLYKLTLKMFSELFQPEKMAQTSQEISQILENEYIAIRDEIEARLNQMRME